MADQTLMPGAFGELELGIGWAAALPHDVFPALLAGLSSEKQGMEMPTREVVPALRGG